MIHRLVSRSRPAAVVGATVAGIALVGCAPTSTDTGEFVILLGTDTTAVEQYTRTPDGFHATAVVRSPRTMVHELELTFGGDGRVERAVATTRDPSRGEEAVPAERTEIAFSDGNATVTEREDGETETRTVDAGESVLPRLLDFYSLQQLLATEARASGRDTLYMLDDGEPVPIAVRRPADDSLEFVTPDFGTWTVSLDARGAIETLFAGRFGRTVTRVDDLDVTGLAETWAARDAAGEGMGPLSPRDTTRASVGGARLVFDYGRPSKRGREVFGEDGLTPWGEVWRAGANRATHFTTDRALLLGETRVPAGTYTIYTIPNPDEWTLIVNRQTGQWGTEYDAERDLARIPMPVTRTDSVVETFTIAVEPSGEAAGVIAFRWDRVRAAAPFRVVSGT